MTVKIITTIKLTERQVGFHMEVDDAEVDDLAESGIAQILLLKFAGEVQRLKGTIEPEVEFEEEL